MVSNKICGCPASAVTYDAKQAPCYGKGLLITYNNVLYIVNKAGPAGVPGSSADYIAVVGGGVSVGAGMIGPTGPMGPQGLMGPIGATGPTGPAGSGSGGAGSVGPTGPTGATGAMGPTGPAGSGGGASSVGPTGPTGGVTIPTFDFNQSHNYKAGQAVLSNGTVFIANKDDPAGLPVNSPDYTPVLGSRGATGATGAVGPTGPTGPTGSGSGGAGSAGPTGPTGPTGAAGATGPTGSNSAASTIVQTLQQTGQNVAAGTYQLQTVTCPAGYVATGGGSRATDSNNQVIAGATVVASRPDPPTAGATPTGWRSGLYFPNAASNVTLDYYAICQRTT